MNRRIDRTDLIRRIHVVDRARAGRRWRTKLGCGFALLLLRLAHPATADDTRPALFVAQGPFGIKADVVSPNDGATNALVIDPDDANVAWAATASGGVWKTSN